jgi:hypothetical protein
VDDAVSVAVGIAVCVADGFTGSGSGVMVSVAAASGMTASGVKVRQANSAKREAKIPIKMRRMTQLYRLQYRFTFARLVLPIFHPICNLDNTGI